MKKEILKTLMFLIIYVILYAVYKTNNFEVAVLIGLALILKENYIKK